MPSEEDFSRVSALAEELQRGGGHAFQPWLAARGAGLKRQSVGMLDAFIDTALQWREPQRRAFVVWLDSVRERFYDKGIVTPHPLKMRVIMPTVNAWREAEPDSPTPYLLLARFHDCRHDDTSPETYYRLAFERDPTSMVAREGIIDTVLDAVDRSQHHLPDTFLGDPAECIARLDEIMVLATESGDEKLAQSVADWVAVLRDRARGVRDDGGLSTYSFPG